MIDGLESNLNKFHIF